LDFLREIEFFEKFSNYRGWNSNMGTPLLFVARRGVGVGWVASSVVWWLGVRYGVRLHPNMAILPPIWCDVGIIVNK
jgi:hypothetical protein